LKTATGTRSNGCRTWLSCDINANTSMSCSLNIGQILSLIRTCDHQEATIRERFFLCPRIWGSTTFSKWFSRIVNTTTTLLSCKADLGIVERNSHFLWQALSWMDQQTGRPNSIGKCRHSKSHMSHFTDLVNIGVL
jgi:hypothetical protein